MSRPLVLSLGSVNVDFQAQDWASVIARRGNTSATPKKRVFMWYPLELFLATGGSLDFVVDAGHGSCRGAQRKSCESARPVPVFTQWTTVPSFGYGHVATARLEAAASGDSRGLSGALSGHGFAQAAVLPPSGTSRERLQVELIGFAPTRETRLLPRFGAGGSVPG